MRTVYLDELFTLNLGIDYFLLLGTAKLCALPYRRLRFALAAALGALWSCLALLPGLGFLTAPVMHGVLAMVMTLTAFGGERRLFRCLFAFLGVSALFGGAVYAAGLYRGYPGAGPLTRLDMRVLLLAFALCWTLLSLVYRRSAANAAREYHEIELARSGRRVRFRALRDTGNGLYDPMTGMAALVAEAEVLEGLFTPAEAALMRGPPLEAMGRVPGLRLIPCAGIDGKTRLLLAFRPDRTSVDGKERRDLLTAVSPASLGGGGSYHAII